jgi:hypothetical protein
MFSRLSTMTALAMALGCASASAAGATAPPTAPFKPVQCEIRSTRVPGGIALETLATAQKRVAGTYRLVVTKNGPAGTSDIVQGGAFRAGRGKDTVLGSVELGIERGASYVAKLSLSWDGQKTVCTKRL